MSLTRRCTLITLASLPLTAVAKAAKPAKRRAAGGARRARQRNLCGQTVVDPYRWMENPKDAEWEPFMRGQDDACPQGAGRHPRPQSAEGASPNCRAALPIAYGVAIGRRHACSTKCGPAGADKFKLAVREGASGAERILIDPTR